ncbi:MAG: MBL fold metallo-hydrolase [Candidatus Binatia bacterium]
MKISFIAHASILVEAHGISILSDPWWHGPCFGAQWWLYPSPYLEPITGQKIDYIYISHGHHDHFHPATLKTFARTTKVLIREGLDFCEPIRQLGFEVIEVPDNQDVNLGSASQPLTCRILYTHNDDTLMTISDGREVCLNLNDAVHALPKKQRTGFTQLLRNLYPQIDYVFCGYGTASHFPNCYVVPGKDREKTAAKRQSHFNHVWANIVHELSPRFAFPFAANVVFLEDDLFWANEPVHNSERPTTVFSHAHPEAFTHAIDIAPGFVIENGAVISPRLWTPVSSNELRTSLGDSIRRVNRVSRVDGTSVREVAALIAANTVRHASYLRTFPGDYSCLIELRDAVEAIKVTKKGPQILVTTVTDEPLNEGDYDLVYTTRLSYLRRSLTTPYGNEILFVGSGGIFRYPQQHKITTNVHRELMVAIKKWDHPLRRDPGVTGGVITSAKQLVKHFLGYKTEDLYDLQTWSVFSPQS